MTVKVTRSSSPRIGDDTGPWTQLGLRRISSRRRRSTSVIWGCREFHFNNSTLSHPLTTSTFRHSIMWPQVWLWSNDNWCFPLTILEVSRITPLLSVVIYFRDWSDCCPVLWLVSIFPGGTGCYTTSWFYYNRSKGPMYGRHEPKRITLVENQLSSVFLTDTVSWCREPSVQCTYQNILFKNSISSLKIYSGNYTLLFARSWLRSKWCHYIHFDEEGGGQTGLGVSQQRAGRRSDNKFVTVLYYNWNDWTEIECFNVRCWTVNTTVNILYKLLFFDILFNKTLWNCFQ